ncbi:hypothetical protein C789_4616 [Microcystis aeruginosa FACHB-905 = DIANCHI905]|uniref:Uncharacterized protein n=1 Tax=Microcystis aeruginosa PCC 7806SL TaxID=1903187 RepID=A0AB33C9G9_MICA7|nr:hypothetical protein BH695_5218 [Microcystis aeruginosa PCC 7806SL]ELS45624.1 hypothetical protein C789_4616 [Microcystis aeruginosa FACHB-905 = DIANCHI905]
MSVMDLEIWYYLITSVGLGLGLLLNRWGARIKKLSNLNF